MSDQITKYLTLAGAAPDGSNHLIDQDASLAAAEYSRGPSTEYWDIKRLRLIICDNKQQSCAGGFGGGPALTNGITVTKEDSSGVVTDFTDGVAIKKNKDLSAIMSRQCAVKLGEKEGFRGDAVTVYDLDFRGLEDSDGLLLDGSAGEKVVLTINDDFTSGGQDIKEFYAVMCGNVVGGC